MYHIFARNVNDAFINGLELIRTVGQLGPSRNGDVITVPAPVMTSYALPWQRVLFSPERDANPFFHLVEAVWMLAGREDVATVERYVKRMATFSDDGETFWGAYGYRWRHYFDHDQLLWAIKRLTADKTDRRVVIAMWDAKGDPNMADFYGKDVPCNTHIYVSIVRGKLDMTVCCRSNDMLWGAYGANAVHFSILQEFLAAAINVPVGVLYQLSNNFHAYVERLEKLAGVPMTMVQYPSHEPIVLGAQTPADFLEECELLLRKDTDLLKFTPNNGWLRRVVRPAMISHKHYKEKNYERANWWAYAIDADDWCRACVQWLDRRAAARTRAEDDGVNYET